MMTHNQKLRLTALEIAAGRAGNMGTTGSLLADAERFYAFLQAGAATTKKTATPIRPRRGAAR